MTDARPPLVPHMMAAAKLRVCLMVWAGLTLARGSPSTSPNSAVMPSVSYLDLPFGWNRSSLEKDIAAVFNKVAYGSSTMPSVIVSHTPGVTRPSPPPTTSTTTLPPSTSATLHIETPEYTSRTRFKPPLPPEYTNPFADKPILRGSQSEHSTAGGHRPLPPPPRPPRPPPEQERIPIRPPDLLVPQDRNKKPLNTPARGTVRPQQAVTYAQETVRIEPRNDTEFDFVPILQNPTVTRILSGSSGRKVEDDIRNLTSRVHLEHLNKELVIAPPPPSSSPVTPPPPPPPLQEEHKVLSDEEEEVTSELPLEEELEQEEQEEQDSEPADHQSQEPRWDSRVWGVAWDIHVYLMGSLFALLALVAIVNFIRTYKRLLPKGYFVILNGILLIIGVFRSIFLFFDAYNLGETYPAVISPLLLNFVFPCLTSAFTVLFLFLVQTAKVQVVSSRLQNAPVVGVITLSHLLLCLSLYFVAGFLLAKFLLLVCQAVFLIWGVTLAVSYLFVFGALSRAALRQQCDFLRAPFTKLATASLPPQNPGGLGLAVRALLATAMLMLLLAAVQLYGVFGVYGVLSDEPPRPWPWWGLQFSVRVIEVSMCFLMVFVATLRQTSHEGTSVFSLFACNNCTPSQEQNKPNDDLYPAICSTNQAIHNYSMHTGKKVYEDSFPLSNMPLGEPIIPVAVRLSMKRSSSARSEGHHSPSSVDSQRPSSMLFAEDGFVRFRTSADPEQPMEEVLHQSLNRPDTFHLPSEEFCLEQQTKVRYRPGEPHIYQQQQQQQGECRGPMWHLSPAHLRHHPSESSADSDLVSDEEPSSSCQDITPDSAVGSDIYSKNGEIPVENSKYWCEELVSRLRGSNFSLHGYTPLDKHAMHACKLEALYNSRPQHESAV